MTDKEKGKAFKAERQRQVKRGVAIQKDAAEEVTRQLRAADQKIRAEMAGQPSDYKQWYLPRLQQAIRQAIDEHGAAATAAVTKGADAAWQAGIDLVDKPLAAGGIDLVGKLPAIDRDQLLAMKTFMTGRMEDVTATTINRINGQLGAVIIGAQSPGDAVNEISRHIEGGRGRAIGIVQTEVGRAYEAASQQRKEQAVEEVPELQKQWRRSGKRNSRPSHDLADGQIQAVDQPFMVGGTAIMYPRDPKAPIKHTARCGCTSLPYMASWEVKHPREKPFTADERMANRNKRDVADLRAADYSDWAGKTIDRKRHATGEIRTVAQLPESVTKKLAPRGIAPMGTDIVIGDRQLLHMRRELHVKRKADALPMDLLRSLPDRLAQPRAIMLDRRAKEPTLVFVIKVSGQARLARVVVKLGDMDRRMAHKRGNIIVTGSLVDKADLADGNAYEILLGKL
ncbi:hypothetical protein [Ferrovibrio terrae]|uniref:hypothetical protein n=1 Tax=Ferrovibrio terrae TaxID=2594003 RepID=UPI003137E257